MDKLKKARGPHRTAVTKVLTDVDALVAQDQPSKDELQQLLNKLEKVQEKLADCDQKIYDFFVASDDLTEADLAIEKVSMDDYEDKIEQGKFKLNKILYPRATTPVPVDDTNSGVTSVTSNVKKNGLKLPKIELKKFNGDFKEWLSFWSQFKKIDEDEGIDGSCKFQYLLQSLVAGSKPYLTVSSYPVTAENYPKAIAQLKERFGKEKLLKQVYVRELLKMISNNSSRQWKVTQIYDELECHLRALESLGVSAEQTAVFLYPMVESSLPEDILVAWQRSAFYGKDGTAEDPQKTEMDYLMGFLKKEVEFEDMRTLAQSGFQSAPSDDRNKKKMGNSSSRRDRALSDAGKDGQFPTVAGLHSGDGKNCMFCDKDSHASFKCDDGWKMTYGQKKARLDKKKGCFICLRTGHLAKDCKSKVHCFNCGKKHYAIMCQGDSKKTGATNCEKEEPEKVNANYAGSSMVLLATLQVTLVNGDCKRTVRGFFDQGAQRSYLGNKAVRDLGLEPVGEESIRHALFGGVQTDLEKFPKFNVNTQHANKKDMSALSVLGRDKICGNLPSLPRGPWMRELKQLGIWISDMQNPNEEIELLIGGDFYGNLLTGRMHHLSNGLTAQETLLGWIITGRLESNGQSDTLAMLVNGMHIADATAEELWGLETLGIRDPYEVKSKVEKEEATKEHFLKTVTRLENGRYAVCLPWVDGTLKIPDNYRIAEQRLRSTTARLVLKGKYNAYDDIFEAWLKEGIVELVGKESYNPNCHYLPHRAVFKPQSLTTPIRPVFDASCKAKRMPSLNDCLEKGPNLLEFIPSILLRFRQRKVGLVSDIRKAFQMVEVNETDRDFLRFLWWEDHQKERIKIFRHRRVVFGVNCSPFLLAAVIESHLKSVSPDRREVAEKLWESLYVDNCVTSVDTHEEYEVFKIQATQIMAEAEMELRMWQCSSGEVSRVGSLGSSECGLGAGRTVTSEDDSVEGVLGMIWDRVNDNICCDVNFSELPAKFSKRNVLSYIQQIYDPLGIVCPVLISPKRILQEAWKDKTGWDDDLSEVQVRRFRKWFEDANKIAEIKVPRYVNGDIVSREFHTFCDASADAYAAVVFLRSVSHDQVSVQLLMAKARIAPLKEMTIPRLELMACTIGCRLTKLVKSAWNADGDPSYFWTDSSTALSWIKVNDEWGTFVGNRVKEILQLSRSEQWRHVPGKQNPADLPSRGCTASQLIKSRWWEGPQWLKCEADNWPGQSYEVDKSAVFTERKKSTVVASVSSGGNQWYDRFSSYYVILRVLAWMYRFHERAKRLSKESSYLTVREIQSVEKILLKMVQREAFSLKKDKQGKIDQLANGIRISRDEDGLIRVNSKLTHRDDSDNFRQPILLPHDHSIVTKIIEEEHKRLGHGGVQLLMSTLREKYWILKGRKTIRKIVISCVTCRRFSAKKLETDPAPLPLCRVQSSRVFETVGIDLAGPLFIQKKKKAWVVLFTCAVYRCVHLELVKSLSTNAFLEAFFRFVNRRGRPAVVYSDNGTNFVGTENLFGQLDWEKITRECGLQRIQWRFNPPSAAWWGGWWERLIRSMKDVLKRVLGKSTLTFDKLRTYLIDVEAFLNQRPLTTVTEDPCDLIPLTPAMFLHELPSCNYSELDFINLPDLKEEYQKRKTQMDEFKSRFRKEYLSQLVQRGKEKNQPEVKVGDVVLVEVENKKRWDWPMAKVIELLTGKDGKTRLVRVKVANGTLLRPIQRLFRLEVSSPKELSSCEQESIVVPDKKTMEEAATKEVKTRFGRIVKVPNRF